ncbi:Lysine-specific demethylase 8 [Golovinomyces cichoracearum]|uniref:Lysine-specific demethylase 8 n=1 Tax=Golovinomyces cichoracearum TaxID=62708 RepID=A0A420IU58_9PEZI|nr:Lysine-specific demethylase 8 [Golovinomyces cichoracearum]
MASILHQTLMDLCIYVFCDTKDLRDILSETSTASELRDCGKPILQLLLQQSTSIHNHYTSKKNNKNLTNDIDYTLGVENNDLNPLITKRLDDLITLATEKFYAFPFKNVPLCWRQLYWEASLLKFSALVVGKLFATSNIASLCHQSVMDELVTTLDMAHIMTGAIASDTVMACVNTALETLQKIDEIVSRRELDKGLKRQRSDSTFQEAVEFTPQVTNAVLRKENISFFTFEKLIQHPLNPHLGPEPLIITDSLKHWPALSHHSWNSPSYLLSRTIGGRRLVPIEVGRSYVDEDWGQKIIPFKEFLDIYIMGNPSRKKQKKGYLAQHNLFSQIPILRNDIAVPDYCYALAPPPHKSSPLATKHAEYAALEEPLLNAWFGPAGTITPLHTDPYHNILAQVVGKKYVRLYAPRESAKLYARGIEQGGIDMQNTSSLDIGLLAGWDGTREEQERARKDFPLFSKAEFVDCILEAGECLYIPIGWWHYVRSLSVSFSVSFWFN